LNAPINPLNFSNVLNKKRTSKSIVELPNGDDLTLSQLDLIRVLSEAHHQNSINNNSGVDSHVNEGFG